MKRTALRTTMAILLGATFLSFVPEARAQDEGGCSNASVAGKWGFTTNNLRHLRALFTSAVLPNNTPLATIITVDAKRLFSEN